MNKMLQSKMRSEMQQKNGFKKSPMKKAKFHTSLAAGQPQQVGITTNQLIEQFRKKNPPKKSHIDFYRSTLSKKAVSMPLTEKKSSTNSVGSKNPAPMAHKQRPQMVDTQKNEKAQVVEEDLLEADESDEEATPIKKPKEATSNNSSPTIIRAQKVPTTT